MCLKFAFDIGQICHVCHKFTGFTWYHREFPASPSRTIQVLSHLLSGQRRPWRRISADLTGRGTAAGTLNVSWPNGMVFWYQDAWIHWYFAHCRGWLMLGLCSGKTVQWIPFWSILTYFDIFWQSFLVLRELDWGQWGANESYLGAAWAPRG